MTKIWKEKIINFRVSEDELIKIDNKWKSLSFSNRSEYLRVMALNGGVNFGQQVVEKISFRGGKEDLKKVERVLSGDWKKCVSELRSNPIFLEIQRKNTRSELLEGRIIPKAEV